MHLLRCGAACIAFPLPTPARVRSHVDFPARIIGIQHVPLGRQYVPFCPTHDDSVSAEKSRIAFVPFNGPESEWRILGRTHPSPEAPDIGRVSQRRFRLPLVSSGNSDSEIRNAGSKSGLAFLDSSKLATWRLETQVLSMSSAGTLVQQIVLRAIRATVP
jgi:hypothetical protein